MWKKTQNQSNLPEVQKDTLIIIGNGFDIWQGLDTSYAQFRAYYLAHRDAILKKLHIKKYTVRAENGAPYQVTDVEIIYGDPFDPSELDNSFWGTFETSLSKVDAERINFFFGKEKSGLRTMKRSIKNASRILKEAFCGWIASIVIENKAPTYDFGANCLFINFNYTDTLPKHFQVDSTNEFHIHGTASDKASIIFGHSDHPQQPIKELSYLGGRFRGLYLIEELLYETDKHVHENIFMLTMFLASHGVNKEDIKDIYVLGHSMSPPDLEYFSFLMDATRTHDLTESEEIPEGSDHFDPIEDLHARINYTIEHYGYKHSHEQADPYQEQAIARRLKLERDAQQTWMEREFLRTMGIRRSWRRPKGEIPPSHSNARTEDAMWHLSYHGDSDKPRKELVMQRLGCRQYELLPTIDACLENLTCGKAVQTSNQRAETALTPPD